jgi:hypothetical protein
MQANPGGLEPAAAVATRPGPGHAALRRRLTASGAPLRSPVLQAVLALAIYLAAWLCTQARPLVEHPASAQLFQTSMDPNFFVWAIRWWPYAIAHGLDPLYTAQVGAPAGYGLAWVTMVAPLGLLAVPVTLTAGPIAAFNLLAAIALPVSGWAAFVLCRRLTWRFWPSLVGGFIFGFSAYEMNHINAGQLDIVYSLLLPLIGYLVVLWRDEAIGSGAFVALLAAALAAQFYLFLETFAGLTGVLALALLAGYAVAGRAARPWVARLSLLVGLAYAIALVLAAPYLWIALSQQPPRWEYVSSLDLASLVVPSPGRTLGLTWLAHAAVRPIPESADGYVGVPLLVIALALAVSAWSSRLVRFLTVMLVVVVVAALGPVVHVGGRQLFSLPWAKVWSLPFLRTAYPSRLMVFAFLVLAVMTALWLSRPVALWARAGLAVLAIAAIVLDTPSLTIAPRSDVPAFVSTGEYRHYLRPGETVLVISTVDNAGMLWQADTGFYDKLAGGYISQILTPRYDLPLVVRNLAQPTPQRVKAFMAFARRARIGAILVETGAEPPWAGIFGRLGLSSRLVGGVRVYATHG